MSPAAAEIARRAREVHITRSPEQTELSQRWLEPVREELAAITLRSRQEVDAAFRANRPSDTGDLMEGELDPAQYPVGYCHHIRDAVWEKLCRETLVRDLRQKGLLWKKVYFIEEGRWLQNAIQCGDRILDAAHDTAQRTYSPVLFPQLDQLAYENLDTWARAAEVAEHYYNLRVFPNWYFPLLFPLVPFLAVRNSGRIELLYHHDLLFLMDLGENWRRLRELIQDDDWMRRRWPPGCEQALERWCGGNDFARFPVEFRKTSAADLEKTLGDWKQVTRLPMAELTSAIGQAGQMARRVAALMRRADLRGTETHDPP